VPLLESIIAQQWPTSGCVKTTFVTSEYTLPILFMYVFLSFVFISFHVVSVFHSSSFTLNCFVIAFRRFSWRSSVSEEHHMGPSLTVSRLSYKIGNQHDQGSFLRNFGNQGSRGSSGSDYELDDRVIEVRSPTEAEDFSCRPCVQTGSEAHPASYPMGTGGSVPGGKARPGRDADHSPPSGGRA
jgi:hypothetical protein